MKTLFGPDIGPDGVRFRVWAPSAETVRLLRPEADPAPMRPAEDGFHDVLVPGVAIGDRYRFEADGHTFPDPASRGQAGDVTGWSLVLPDEAPRTPWSSRTVRPWHEVVLAELHVGTASEEGTFAGLARTLTHWRAAGFTAIELMPVADFPGRRNWGYDGVLPFAPDTAYGTPDDLRALVDAAHALGLGVMLDVVYNHFGPVSIGLERVAAPFFTAAHATPWGPAINLDDPIVRRFFVENAVYWLDSFGFDGLRFDAVHAFVPQGGDRLLEEIAEAARAVKPDAWLVLENDHNAARWLDRDDTGRPRFYTAQWNDDGHHVLHALATGEVDGYYADYADDLLARTARALAQGFVYQGEPSAFRAGTPRGEPSEHLPPEAFVGFVQNHDQIGNRPFGDRLAERVSPDRLAFLRFVTMLSPQVPMFFQGEEFGATTPFPFFCDFDGPLADGVREGRKREFADFFARHHDRDDLPPDPLDEATFSLAKLPATRDEVGRTELAAFSALAARRRDLVWPLAASPYLGAATSISGDAILVVWSWEAGRLVMALNPSASPARIPWPFADTAADVGTVDVLEDEIALGPWSAALGSLAP